MLNLKKNIVIYKEDENSAMIYFNFKIPLPKFCINIYYKFKHKIALMLIGLTYKT